MTRLPKAYEGLVLPLGYDPIKTNYRVAKMLRGWGWYFRVSGLAAVTAGFYDIVFLIGGGVALGLSQYLMYERNKTLDAAERIEAERKLHYEEREGGMREDLGRDLSDELP